MQIKIQDQSPLSIMHQLHSSQKYFKFKLLTVRNVHATILLATAICI